MAGLLGRVRRFTKAGSKTIGKPQVDECDGQHQQLRCYPKLRRRHDYAGRVQQQSNQGVEQGAAGDEYPGNREHRGYDADDSGWQNGRRLSPGDQLSWANSQGQVFSHG